MLPLVRSGGKISVTAIKEEIFLHSNVLVTCLLHTPCEDVPRVLDHVFLHTANPWVCGSPPPWHQPSRNMEQPQLCREHWQVNKGRSCLLGS